MGLREIDLMRVAENRTGPRTWELVQRSFPCRLQGSALQSGHVDENDPVALDGGAGCETSRSAVALAGFEREAPTMIAADEPVAFDFALAEQRALMGTTALEARQPAPVRTSARSTPLADTAKGPWPARSCDVAARIKGSGFMQAAPV